MGDLRALVANCLMGGDRFSTHPSGRIRDLVDIECDGFLFRFRQKPNVIRGPLDQFKDCFVETSEVVVCDVETGAVQIALKVLDRICWLLSFAGLSRVVRYAYEYPDGSGLGEHRSVAGVANHFRPSLDIQDGKIVKSFVEEVYPVYRGLEKRRKLNVVIDYLVQAERPGQPIELGLLLLFIALENLKGTYAKSKSIPYIAGRFRQGPTRKSAPYSFEVLLEMMLREVGMRKGLTRVIRLRNEIVHTGLSKMRHSRQLTMHESIHDLIREYLIRLLGYEGSYLAYSDRTGRPYVARFTKKYLSQLRGTF